MEIGIAASGVARRMKARVPLKQRQFVVSRRLLDRCVQGTVTSRSPSDRSLLFAHFFCSILVRPARRWVKARCPDRLPSFSSPPTTYLPFHPPSSFLRLYCRRYCCSWSAVLHVVRAMSLNGLDHPAIAEAYQSALADAGGWYVSPCARPPFAPIAPQEC